MFTKQICCVHFCSNESGLNRLGLRKCTLNMKTIVLLLHTLPRMLYNHGLCIPRMFLFTVHYTMQSNFGLIQERILGSVNVALMYVGGNDVLQQLRHTSVVGDTLRPSGLAPYIIIIILLIIIIII